MPGHGLGGAINSLTSGPIYSVNNPVSSNIGTTQIFEENLAALGRAMDPSSTNPLTITDVSNTLQAEAESIARICMLPCC